MFFFQNYWIPIKLLILIESPNTFHWKPAKKQRGCCLKTKFGQIRSNV